MSATPASGQEARLRRTLESLWRDISIDAPVTGASSLSSADLMIPTSEGPLRLALDPEGRRHLLVPLPTSAAAVEDKHSSGVHLDTRVLVIDDRPVRCLDLVCRRSDLVGVFTGLVADVCLALAPDPREPGKTLARTLTSWRELFGEDSPAWTVPRLAGLFGELLVLEEILRRRPTASAFWVGPTGTAQDFRSDRNAIEVKTSTTMQGRVVRIHGIDQLDPPTTGFLSLVWCRVLLSKPGTGDSVPAAIARCLALGGDQPLLSLLDRLKLPPLTTSELLTTTFELGERRLFDIDEDFPRITPDRFGTRVTPAGVGGVEYLVDLDVVAPSDEDLGALVDRFLDGS
ncbi:PD-(D/E)XK motif protein [Actinoplanes awajinensis]|uniref:PD-(D/E)XK motif protein n=1 Tax=Actinoplanes awajinensis subsp. mycoplanecinus TaxID=135947 RepID=A0A101JRQ0_9ACTN|nr:PD-(D/E)XK motif protein [Actinoplanes awajinensis]KUL31458.1 hypothetical protein ADL15_22255 [Actinoplanes awajinensis subsp. mycoplanecinus]